MRKSIRVLILLLMLVTSLTAGTMAVYTSRIDLAPVTISAKRFALGVNQGGQDEFDLRIGPGEMVSYQFVVTNQTAGGNVSEVDMDLMVNADFSAITAALPDVEITLLLSDNQVASVGSSGSLSYQKSALFKASQPKEVRFSLNFFWRNGDIPAALLDGNAVVLPLTVYVKGVQHV